MLIGWLILGLFIGFFVAAVSIAATPQMIAHMREVVELHNDYLAAKRDLQNARAELKKDAIVFCSTCEKEITVDEARKICERLIALAGKK